jgi:hypothetical protein
MTTESVKGFVRRQGGGGGVAFAPTYLSIIYKSFFLPLRKVKGFCSGLVAL